MTDPSGIKALAFDVFGTVVDWRSGVIRAGEELDKRDVDWPAFADAWRTKYVPSMDRVRHGDLPWTNLDTLHRASLEELLEEFRVKGLTNPEIDHLNKAWHRLDPWPDSVGGLTRLKDRHIIAPLSNGNVALLTNMAKRAGLPWDLIFSAELVRHYKPDPETYLMVPGYLDLRPEQVAMVAAHPDDLQAAARHGLKTVYVPRPDEWGPEGQAPPPDPAFDLVVKDLVDLAKRLTA